MQEEEELTSSMDQGFDLDNLKDSGELQLREQGHSQSSFRSYTNHHMDSGSNHSISQDIGQQTPRENDSDIECDTCLDRNERMQLG